MAPDDRDRTFEKALARHLRYVAPSGQETGHLTSSALPCPDPEVLAAYHDDSLSPDERTLWKQHVLSCDRCQLVLEHLATPLDVPTAAESDERRLIAAHTDVAAVSAPAPAVAAAPPVPAVRPSPRKNYFWWLAPAGAVAAGVLAILVVNTRRAAGPIATPQSAPIEVAKNEESPVARYAEPSPTPPAAPATKTETTAEAGGRLPAVAPSPAHAESKEKTLAADSLVGGAPSSTQSAGETNLRDTVALAKKAPNVAKPAPGERLLYETGASARARDLNQPSNQKDDKLREQVAALDAEMKKQGLRQQTPAATPPSGAGQAGYLADNTVAPSAAAKAAPAAPPPPPPSGAASPKPAEAQPARTDTNASGAASASLEIAAAPRKIASMRGTLLQNPHVLEAPGGKISWRFGAAGSIEHSTNKGKDWTPQASGVATDLVAGSAPSAKAAWIVGASGTILRTTDGGAHWIKLNSPSTADLVGVRATDALHAYIWFAADERTGTVPSYLTTDGGSTWVLVPAA